jgi:hypothetical protein
MATETAKEKSLARIVAEGMKAKEGGSFEAGAVTIQPRGNRVDIVPTEPIEPQPMNEVATGGSDTP